MPVEEATEKLWSLSLGGGGTLVSGGDDPWSVSVDLTRSLSDASVSLGFARSIDPGSPQVPTALGSKTNQFSLSAGYGFGAVGVDVHASYGRRQFEGRSFRRRTGQTLTIDGKGESYAVGATASVQVPLGGRTSLSPYVSVDYESTDTARAAVLPVLGLVSVKDKENGTTGSLGSSLDRSFGKDGAHSISANAAWVVTSNSAARSGSITRRSGGVRNLRPQAGAGGSESWFEYGASLGFALASGVGLSLSASRTAGIAGAESSSLYSSVSISF